MLLAHRIACRQGIRVTVLDDILERANLDDAQRRAFMAMKMVAERRYRTYQRRYIGEIDFLKRFVELWSLIHG